MINNSIFKLKEKIVSRNKLYINFFIYLENYIKKLIFSYKKKNL